MASHSNSILLSLNSSFNGQLDQLDDFEVFDPRGLFSPPNSSPDPPRQAQLHDLFPSPDCANPPRLQPPLEIQIPAPNLNPINKHSPINHHSLAYLNLDPHHNLHDPFDDNPPSPFVHPNTPRPTSPFDSPISPCSSLPFCRSPPASLSDDPALHSSPPPHSFSRGRSSLPRSIPDPRPLAPLCSSSPRHYPGPGPGPGPQSRLNFSHVHPIPRRPSPIITAPLTRDSSLPTRLSRLESPDICASVSSLAYSDMDASPAVNFLASFADSTLPLSQAAQSPSDNLAAPGMLTEGDTVTGYLLGPIIGRGGFSVVRQATHLLTDQKAAVKIVRRTIPPGPGRRTTAPLARSSPRASGSFSKSAPRSAHATLHSSIVSRDQPTLINGHLVNSAHLPLPTSATEMLANALLRREIQIWASLKPHPNLVPLLSLHETASQTLLFMPICEGGNLLQLLNRVKLDPREQDKLRVAMQAGCADSPPALCAGQSSLSSHGLGLDLVRKIFGQIVDALKYLHLEAGIVHKDIKLENILIQHGQIKISDFGLAVFPSYENPPGHLASKAQSSAWSRDLSLPKQFNALPRISEGNVAEGISWAARQAGRGPQRASLLNSFFSQQPAVPPLDDNDEEASCSLDEVVPTAAGSLAYTPPEQLRSELPLARPSLDIWALGCVLYGLLEGRLPFEDDFEPRLRLKIMNGQYAFPGSLKVSDEEQLAGSGSGMEDERLLVAKTLKGCLAVDRNARWTIEEVAVSAWLGRASGGMGSEEDDEEEEEDDDEYEEDSLSQLVAAHLSSHMTNSGLADHPRLRLPGLSHAPLTHTMSLSDAIPVETSERQGSVARSPPLSTASPTPKAPRSPLTGEVRRGREGSGMGTSERRRVQSPPPVVMGRKRGNGGQQGTGQGRGRRESRSRSSSSKSRSHSRT